MLKEFLEYVVKLAQDSNITKVVAIPQEPNHRYLLTKPGGLYEMRDAIAAPRDHVCNSLTDFCSYLLTWCADREENLTDFPVVWFSREGVTGILDDTTRRDQVSLLFHLSPQIILIQQLEKARNLYDQKAFISLLRIGFHGCLSAQPNLIDVLRRVKFRSQQGADTKIEHGKESLGRQIEQQLTGEGIIPEEIRLRVPIFEGLLPNYAEIPCALEIFASEEKFQIIPYPGAIEKAICEVEALVGVALRQELAGCAGITCFYGTP